MHLNCYGGSFELVCLILFINMMHLEHAMHHPMIVHFTLLLIACLSFFACLLLRGLDDDVEVDDTYVYPTEEFVQYQATDIPGKYSLT